MAPEHTTIAAVIVALGGREVIGYAARALVDHTTGKATRQRSRVQEIMADLEHAESKRDAAEADRDHQAKWRRMLQEYGSQLRSLLIERHGVSPADLPPVPPEPTRKQ